MQHLSTEDLARLVDESPIHAERAHLDGCTACQSELEALRAQTRALAGLPPLPAPPRAWPLLEARLRHEGLIRQAARSAPWGAPRWLRAAAYAGLFLLGGASGLALGRGWDGDAAVAAVAAVQTAQAARTAEEAALQLRELETAYLSTLARYNELTGAPRDADPAARLAALEGIVLSTRAALEAAPADPVINGYYLTAVGQREAVLRQIAQTSAEPWF